MGKNICTLYNGLRIKIYKTFSVLNNINYNQKLEEKKKEEDIKVANRHIKNSEKQPLLIVRKMKVKMAMRWHLTPVRFINVRKTGSKSAS